MYNFGTDKLILMKVHMVEVENTLGIYFLNLSKYI